MKAKNQLVNEATELPGALTLAGKISPNMSQGIGPAPMPKAAIKRIRDVNGNQPREEISVSVCSLR